jgi:hypothetical protein
VDFDSSAADEGGMAASVSQAGGGGVQPLARRSSLFEGAAPRVARVAGSSAAAAAAAAGALSAGPGPESLAEDPLGLSALNLAAVEQLRLRARGQGSGRSSGGGGRRGSFSVGFAAKQELIGRLKGDATPADGDASGGSGGGGSGNGSVLPTSAAFDPVAFLTLVHGRASFAELVRGRERLLTQVTGHGRSSLSFEVKISQAGP